MKVKNKRMAARGDCLLTGCSANVAKNAPRNDRNEEGRGDPAGSTFAASWKSARTFGSVLREPCPYGS